VTATEADEKLTLAGVYQRHGEFVWRTLSRMGVARAHLDDVFQEVFLVVHRRLDSFHGHCLATTWLYEICLRVASGYRRRAHFRREELVADVGDVLPLASPRPSPEQAFERRQDTERLNEVLSALTLEQRAVFTMFELEGETCESAALALGLPIGTVYSRLFRARGAFKRALLKQRARDAHYEARLFSAAPVLVPT
jgi:RNA polymerase sigma-70 factor (ECF subfamily)